ncbi:unnamed protein product [Phytophthora fragariaefolia]|uniref:Unnamed protein product n=1 Tax=Phytophthora fragariaefolia TaxID=1490495 RepID=A0A9W7CWT5_9STRA|nr:unnamed protein product [Phytophthora fragariaefolia]
MDDTASAHPVYEPFQHANAPHGGYSVFDGPVTAVDSSPLAIFLRVFGLEMLNLLVLPSFQQQRVHCALCIKNGVRLQTTVVCAAYKLPLCLSSKRNCFAAYTNGQNGTVTLTLLKQLSGNDRLLFSGFATATSYEEAAAFL